MGSLCWKNYFKGWAYQTTPKSFQKWFQGGGVQHPECWGDYIMILKHQISSLALAFYAWMILDVGCCPWCSKLCRCWHAELGWPPGSSLQRHHLAVPRSETLPSCGTLDLQGFKWHCSSLVAHAELIHLCLPSWVCTVCCLPSHFLLLMLNYVEFGNMRTLNSAFRG